MTPRFGRVITAMVTPFDDRGELDLDAAAELANWLVETGSDGLVLAGTTGESPTLTESEELVLFRTVRDAVTVPIIAGAGSNSTASSSLAVPWSGLVTLSSSWPSFIDSFTALPPRSEAIVDTRSTAVAKLALSTFICLSLFLGVTRS